MHVVFREQRSLDETDAPFDPGQDPADLVVLSFSDSDLGAFAAGWRRAREQGAPLPPTRLCNLVALKHPVSVDAYVERTLEGAKAVMVRLIGGEDYWAYGLAALQDLARDRQLAIAVLPADGRPDPRLDALSTLPVSTLRRLNALCDAGGAVAAQAALSQLALAAGLYAKPVIGAKTLPEAGFYRPDRGVVAPEAIGAEPYALIAFYRSYLTAADTAPIDDLIDAYRARGLDAYGFFAPSLKGAAARTALAQLSRAPDAIMNATAFSAKGEDGKTALDIFEKPVFQLGVSTNRRKEWAAAERGLSPANLAMHVVLPEVDGRLFAGVVSFKTAEKRDPDLQYSRFSHRTDAERLAAALARAEAHRRLDAKRNDQKRLALVLSTYPGRAHQMAHAVGLDAIASVDAALSDLAEEGYAVEPVSALAQALGASRARWPIEDYRRALARLPEKLRADLDAAWGSIEDDPACGDGAFHFPALRAGAAIVALQPERGEARRRKDDYHDLERTPRHGYVAFYLWLRSQGLDALVHMGAHGTLEWLPGKATALGAECWPEALIGDLPVIYPFIVNDPGEAAQAKRRIGAIALGHLPPPLEDAATPEDLHELERLLDEYSTADGLDPKRRERLIDAILEEARRSGVERDLDLPDDAAPAEAIPRIDRFVCDLKESRYGDGMHVFGRGACGEAEREGLSKALGGVRVAPGPSGSPYRGRSDVYPTGRNLFAVDPRAVPTASAHAQGVAMAEELLRRHLQDHGDWPANFVVDLWGSATMRTAGEEVAMALHLAGAAPRWDEGSGRVSGFQILPLAELGRPRIDVTLRVSGLFRDVFPGLAQLFESCAAALAERDWEGDDNPYLKKVARVFGPKPGRYGIDAQEALDDFTEEARAAAADAWLRASSWAIGADGAITHDRAGVEARVGAAEGFVHPQDLAESDLLLAADYAVHEAGFAAAAKSLGATPALYHLDITRPDRPRARALGEEVARVVRARAANPAWVDGMMRHGFRGGGEIAATLDHLASFAHLAGVVPPHLFDLYHEATLGREDVRAFLERDNPAALAAMRDLFARLRDAGLWTTRSNSIAMSLEAEG